MDFAKIEKKWQQAWEKAKIFKVKENSKKKKFYCLEMFPYPSGSGLHMGHAFNYTIGDIYARFKRMQGYNVLYPMGYDAFGLPAENAAIKEKIHPKEFTDKAINNFIKQQKELGSSYDWSRMFKTCSPEYYRWNQWLFLQFLKKGLAYRKESYVNWCPDCDSVLANEQVHNGKCWRHKDTNVVEKKLEQWFLNTTKYADELLKDLSKLDWPARIKVMQENWIGKSHGTEIIFKVNGEDWKVFTTRPDTLFGVTFMVVSSQHPRLNVLITKHQKQEVENFTKRTRVLKGEEVDKLEKDGVFTGSYAIHPLTKEKIPIYAGNFVVADYGSGMVMAVPAHDQRDYDFAKKYNIPIKVVINPITGTPHDNEEFRRSIVAVVENPKTGKVLSINWGKLGGNLFIGGGIENNEDELKTAIREIKEETGYKNVKFISKSEKIYHHYVAHSKNVNRKIEAVGFYFKLENEEKENKKLVADEKGKFTVEWIPKEEALKRVKDQLHTTVFRRLVLGEAHRGSGIITNSGRFDGLESEKAKEEITNYLKSKGLGKKTIQYKLKDWLVSRQRYWGTPIPVVYCKKCGIVPVKEKELPIKLPVKVKFGKGNPLETNESFVKTKCPKCKSPARRETDTMDTFFDSSWYFLRYCDSKNLKEAFDKKKVAYWLPVDQYIGGAEHACMHLIYARFFTKALRDLGFLKFDEPFMKLFNQGMLHGDDGFVMAKSRGNVVLPEEISKKYGIDTARLFLVSIASPDRDIAWSDKGIEGSSRFTNRLLVYVTQVKFGKSSERILSKLHKAILEISEDINLFRYNLAVIKIRSLFDSISENSISKFDFCLFLKILHPLCPHITEELWQKLGNKGFISLESWPKADKSKINLEFEKEEEVQSSLIKDITNILNIVRQKGSNPKKVFVYCIPKEKEVYSSLAPKISALGLEIKVYAVNDKEKHDPQNKAGKAKPGKAAIYME
ncbi:MAG TPA: class I tRNA ligase family protein [Candidatus Nanoarchaeia archaeon]|nr:class I tRNA ligase family protein [Candidatus Nanoarchaeia archaeon]